MAEHCSELLIEIGCEEMPASWLPVITDNFVAVLESRLTQARIACESPSSPFNTPRRFGVSIPRMHNRQADLEEMITGPPVSASFAPDGSPRPSALGFARKQGVQVDDLDRVQTEKGEYLAYNRRQQGKDTIDVLPQILADTLRHINFPKQMHWDAVLDDGHGEFVFGRPIRWVLFLFAGRVVPFEISRTPGADTGGVERVCSGNVTYGHRFFCRRGEPGVALPVDSFESYKKTLADAYVLIDREGRRGRIANKLEKCADKVGGKVAPLGRGSALLDEVPDLVEYPAVVTGSFPEEFLSLPDEVLSTTMIHHQHYFPVIDGGGQLKANFLAVTNTPRDNVARIARNSERVLVARLRDARFFWDGDREHRLDDRLGRLDTLLFHKKLGSYREKSNRVSLLAAKIVGDVLGQTDAVEHVQRAALLSKADLATDMVGEFPELQGVMGGIYAREQGEPEEVWKAIYYHYLPVGIQSDAPPIRDDLGRANVTWAALSIADKIDTVVGLFGVGEKPTGSRDPLGIRRQAQGILRVLTDLPVLVGLERRISIGHIRRLARSVHGELRDDGQERESVFFLERARYLLEERGFDVRNVRAVTHGDIDELCPLDALRKLQVLPEFTDTSDFQRLATLFKRVKNIARELSVEELDEADRLDPKLTTLLTEPAERSLLEELSTRQAVIETAVSSGKGYRQAFADAAKLGPAVDRFFTDVFVMADDVVLRRARLRLVKRVEQLIVQLADVSELVQES
jgi:glycyl-tRNA synthetase beta chain|tara:strand:+ start:2641 stop:4872 length:2232 start_codon:yes stop_codon:yes gene_type:complete